MTQDDGRRGLVGGARPGLGHDAGGGSAAAFSQEPLQQSGLIDPSQIPSVHNTLYQVPEGAVGWDLLGDLDVRAEVVAPLQTVFHTDYRPEVKALDGREAKVMGFLFPLEGGLEHDHFLLTAWPPALPVLPARGPLADDRGVLRRAGRLHRRRDPAGRHASSCCTRTPRASTTACTRRARSSASTTSAGPASCRSSRRCRTRCRPGCRLTSASRGRRSSAAVFAHEPLSGRAEIATMRCQPKTETGGFKK